MMMVLPTRLALSPAGRPVTCHVVGVAKPLMTGMLMEAEYYPGNQHDH
jgi:hypothetical protein